MLSITRKVQCICNAVPVRAPSLVQSEIIHMRLFAESRGAEDLEWQFTNLNPSGHQFCVLPQFWGRDVLAEIWG